MTKIPRKVDPKRIAKKMAIYAAAGTTVSVGGLSMAEADVMNSATSVTVGTIGESVDFDVDGDGTNDFNISVTSSFNGANAGGTFPSTFFTVTGLGSNLVGLNTGTAATINAVNQYLVGFVGSFASVGTAGVFGAGDATESAAVMFIRYPGTGGDTYGFGGVFGLQFDIGGQTHFGGMRLDPNINGTQHTFNFQWETTANLAYGAVPEPSSLSLFAMGAAGLAYRRRRTKK